MVITGAVPATQCGPHAGERAVLLVEDEVPLRMIIARNVARRGYDLIAVTSVEDAETMLRRHRPAVVVLDINLPDGTGWEILRWLRAARERPAVIVYSAVPPAPKRIAEFHPDAVLMKPFPIECLLELIETVCPRADDGVPTEELAP